MPGPYDVEADALAEPMPMAVRALHESGAVRSGDPERLVHNVKARALLDVLGRASVDLGLHDGAVIDWLARWEPSTVQAVVDWVGRAFEAGRTVG